MFNYETITKLQAAKRIIVAYSGGLDSSVLLHSLKLAFDKPVIAIHVNHGLSPNAKQWQQHCADFCQQFEIKLIAKSVNLPRDTGESLEALAREARYQIFTELLEQNDVLVIGHHQDDQAETVLLQLFRGAGVKGLSAMPQVKPFAASYVIRPLLNYSREQLTAYAEQYALTYITDESNFDVSFDRNFLRQEIIPRLKQKWPALDKVLARSANHAAESQSILDQVAAQDLVQCQVAMNQIDIAELNGLSEARQKNLLRYWMQQQCCQLPSEAVLLQILQACYAKVDTQPEIKWLAFAIRRHKQKLYLEKAREQIETDKIIPWQNQYQIDDLNFTLLDGCLTLRYRKGGERFHPHNRDKSQTLKKLMQEWQIPTWQRDQVPLLYCDETLVAVVGYAIAKGYQHAD